ncbi:MAG: L-threonylcarbamoyladenylate synthase [Bacteroidia bacterium]|nr:L-threonylcarbamoyladenylate synthase [Bacteroidia bacterium]
MTLQEDLRAAVDVLRKGGIILYPTDTVWGIGCDATNEAAVKKIYELKRRSESKSMILLFDTVGRVERYVDNMPDVAYDMMDMSDKPLTLILDGAKGIAINLVPEDGTIAVRVSAEQYSSSLVRMLQKPIVSTSANISGEPTAAIFSEISQEIIDGVDYVAEFRREDTKKSKPSSIIRLSNSGLVKIIRE